jgi:hypothetical protein
MAKRCAQIKASYPLNWLSRIPNSVCALSQLAIKNFIRLLDPPLMFGSMETTFQPFWELMLNSFAMFAPCLFARQEKRYMVQEKQSF